jgi:histidinol-phosphate aminotransferase
VEQLKKQKVIRNRVPFRYWCTEEIETKLPPETEIELLVRPEVAQLESHLPGDSLEVASRRLGLKPDDIIKLDANENPYGCSVRVQELLASFDAYHLYPDSLHSGLRLRLEKYSGVRRENIVLTNGVNDLTDMIMRVFVRPGDEVLICPPTVSFYRFYAELAGAHVSEVARQSQNFELQIEEVLPKITPKTKVILVGSPNNPTGNMLESEDLIKLLQRDVIVVIDESFSEFASNSHAGLVGEFDNLIVMRSFSHWAGLAGMRVAYGLASPEILRHLWKLRAIYKLNTAQLLAVEAVLDDTRYYKAVIGWLRNERGRLYRQLRKLNFLQPLPSQGNFILCKVVRGEAFSIKKRLEKKGIFIKAYNTPALPNHLRITVGRPEDTDTLLRTLLDMAEDI